MSSPRGRESMGGGGGGQQQGSPRGGSRDDGSEQPVVQVLGGANEVGRSCIIISYKGRRIMLDCGSHPGKSSSPSNPAGGGGGSDMLVASPGGDLSGVVGEESTGHWPEFRLIAEPEKIDLVLITHFHLDHCAALPIFTENVCKGAFKGKIFTTHATKAIMKLSLADTCRLQSNYYDEKELQRCMDRVETIDFYQTISYRGIQITPVKAGHVLGACMFHIEIEGFCLLYTGDYSTEVDLHLPSADIEHINALGKGGKRPDLLICECTHGTEDLEGRKDREDKLDHALEEILFKRGGNVLLPIFALGRAQELMLLIEQLWRKNPKFSKIKVYFKSEMGKKAMRSYSTFPYSMNSNIQKVMDFRNPFDFEYIEDMPDMQQLQTPCVVLANPGFMDSGKSRELFELWCDDKKNGVLICGYAIEGTLVYKIENEMKTQKIFGTSKENQEALSSSNVSNEFTAKDGHKKKVLCSVDCISFSAHVSYSENLKFMTAVAPKTIMLVHGKKNNIKNIAKRLTSHTYWIVDDGSEGAREARAKHEDLVRKAEELKLKNATFVGGQLDPRLRPIVLTPEIGIPERIQLLESRFASMGMGSLATDALLLDNSINSSTSSSSSSNNNNSSSSSSSILTNKFELGSDVLIVRENFESKVMRRGDLSSHSRIKAGFIRQRIVLPVPPELSILYTDTSMEAGYSAGSDNNSSSSSSSNSSNSSNSSGGGGASCDPGLAIFLLKYLLDAVQEVFEDAELILSSSSFSSSSSSSSSSSASTSTSSSSFTTNIEGPKMSIQGSSVTVTVGTGSSSFISSTSESGSPVGDKYIYFVSWEASPVVDTVADSVIALITHRLGALSIVQYQHLCVKRQREHSNKREKFDGVPTNTRLFIKKDVNADAATNKSLFQFARDEDEEEEEELAAEHSTEISADGSADSKRLRK